MQTESLPWECGSRVLGVLTGHADRPCSRNNISNSTWRYVRLPCEDSGLANSCWLSHWLAGVFTGADFADRVLGLPRTDREDCYATRNSESQRGLGGWQ